MEADPSAGPWSLVPDPWSLGGCPSANPSSNPSVNPLC